jgi:hypothetical protein
MGCLRCPMARLKSYVLAGILPKWCCVLHTSNWETPDANSSFDIHTTLCQGGFCHIFHYKITDFSIVINKVFCRESCWHYTNIQFLIETLFTNFNNYWWFPLWHLTNGDFLFPSLHLHLITGIHWKEVLSLLTYLLFIYFYLKGLMSCKPSLSLFTLKFKFSKFGQKLIFIPYYTRLIF